MTTKEQEAKDVSPTMQYLELTKDEKRRMTALGMAIQAYQGGPRIAPGTISEMVAAAVQFDFFLATGGSATPEEVRGGMKTTGVIGADDKPAPTDK